MLSKTRTVPLLDEWIGYGIVHSLARFESTVQN